MQVETTHSDASLRFSLNAIRHHHLYLPLPIASFTIQPMRGFESPWMFISKNHHHYLLHRPLTHPGDRRRQMPLAKSIAPVAFLEVCTFKNGLQVLRVLKESTGLLIGMFRKG
uniref:Uncharacterized protein n=1 Tax=Lactuca sativa TaxID=4236 RepID=A0A9R1W6Q4_LACSA|nr:hypothetical protein LSAT_V11C300153120 [Lactuca sativa]